MPFLYRWILPLFTRRRTPLLRKVFPQSMTVFRDLIYSLKKEEIYFLLHLFARITTINATTKPPTGRGVWVGAGVSPE